MIKEGTIDEMVEACLRAHELVKVHGTPEMQATMRILLFQVGRKIADRRTESPKKRDGE